MYEMAMETMTLCFQALCEDVIRKSICAENVIQILMTASSHRAEGLGLESGGVDRIRRRVGLGFGEISYREKRIVNL